MDHQQLIELRALINSLAVADGREVRYQTVRLQHTSGTQNWPESANLSEILQGLLLIRTRQWPRKGRRADWRQSLFRLAGLNEVADARDLELWLARLLSVSPSEVCFRWNDHAHHSHPRNLTLASEEFLRVSYSVCCHRAFPPYSLLRLPRQPQASPRTPDFRCGNRSSTGNRCANVFLQTGLH